mmetsp:Transcript_64120/g.88688  ORF Transcript_64120/g.88688 Transcript_64120/m.88688 type:complete len:103 (+) Transcript_64120:1047-1355(+)
MKVHGVNGQNAFREAPLYLFVAIGGIGAALCVGILNMAMRNYNQLEVMPIYQSSIIVNTLMCGLFILNEQRFYSVLNIVYICLCCMLCISGDFVILKKPDNR